ALGLVAAAQAFDGLHQPPAFRRVRMEDRTGGLEQTPALIGRQIRQQATVGGDLLQQLRRLAQALQEVGAIAIAAGLARSGGHERDTLAERAARAKSRALARGVVTPPRALLAGVHPRA